MTTGSNPTWYKDAIIYELHVRAFYDSVTDGIGDFAGLTQKLDYLVDLGVTALWLLPFCPSPLRDDGYDIADYTDVNPQYGTLRDFQRFLKEAHRRGLRVITELVLNHTSDQHVWFQRSRRAAPGTRWRDFYVWSDTPDKYKEARIIFKDFEASNWTWDPVAKAYYWHRFYSHQPDLNYDNPQVRAAMLGVMDFWFDMGVDGLRLDAVPYLFEREGTNCENLPETHAALKEIRRHVDEKYADRMLLAEANQWPEDSVAYFGNGDECHMAFHFPVMPRLFMSVRMEDRYPVTDILKLTPAIAENCQWAMFLRNHDELTLEMVTDEERDYMYRTYARDRQMRINLGIRRRLAPLLENDRRRIELMNGLLLSLPGTPVIYYGDEIGMGDNVFLGDRNGVRTPMQWSPDRNAGFSRANPQRLYLPVNIDPEYHYEAVNVETQQNNPHSLLWWMKRLIAQRKQFRAFGRGSLDFLYPPNRRVLAFVRSFDDESILVIANLSRFTQCTQLDLSKYEGMTPIEMFGHSRFPIIGKEPYLLSLGPHAFYWFHLLPREMSQEAITLGRPSDTVPAFAVESWDEVFSSGVRAALSRMMPRFLRNRRWFLGKNRTIRSAEVWDVVRLGSVSSFILLVAVEYSDADAETYVLPLSVAVGEDAARVQQEHPDAVLARLDGPKQQLGIIYSAAFDKNFGTALLHAIMRRRRFKGDHGELIASHTRAFRTVIGRIRSNLEPALQPSEQNNTLIAFGEDFMLKLIRKIEPGIHPAREVEEFLTEAGFANIPPALGAVEYSSDPEQPGMTLTVLSGYKRNVVNAWTHTVDHLGLFFERALATPRDDARFRELATTAPLMLSKQQMPALMAELLGGFAENARLLGRRTAEMHLALASRPDLPDFAPEPFTDFYRQGLYHGMLGQLSRSLDTLRSRLPRLPEAVHEPARRLLERESQLAARLHPLRDQRIPAMRIRQHGDYHLGQVLFAGNDFIIIDFEGDPNRPVSERRIKRSPLRDVASMIRSFHYVAHAALYGQVPGIVPRPEAVPQLEQWADGWYRWVSAVFLDEYMHVVRASDLLPHNDDALRTLFTAYMIQKALIEIEYEIEHRPDWLRIPVVGILALLEEHE